MAADTITVYDRAGLFNELDGVCTGKIKTCCLIFSILLIHKKSLVFLVTLCW
jgi:hypothetical protein